MAERAPHTRSQTLGWAGDRLRDAVRHRRLLLGISGQAKFLDEARDLGIRPKEVWLYSLVRNARPLVVVETGVCEGRSSGAILRAMNTNGEGHLYSIDLPTYEEIGRVNQDGVADASHVLENRGVGHEVPAYLRARWTLLLGDSRELLPPLLERLGCVDMFVHDSDHSYEHQRWEYRTAWPYIAPLGGILASDDTDWTPAFEEFASEVAPTGRHRVLRLGTKGAIMRSSEP
jgi:predicted O-methyltransferase YrrM